MQGNFLVNFSALFLQVFFLLITSFHVSLSQSTAGSYLSVLFFFILHCGFTIIRSSHTECETLTSKTSSFIFGWRPWQIVKWNRSFLIVLKATNRNELLLSKPRSEMHHRNANCVWAENSIPNFHYNVHVYYRKSCLPFPVTFRLFESWFLFWPKSRSVASRVVIMTGANNTRVTRRHELPLENSTFRSCNVGKLADQLHAEISEPCLQFPSVI